MDIIKIIRNLQIKGDVLAIANKFAYNGYTPDNLFIILRTKEPVAEILLSDIMILLAVGMTRGTNIKNILARSQPDARDQLKALIVKYSIQQNVGDSKDRNVVTIARIMSTFPHLCYEMAALGVIRDPVGDKCLCPNTLRFSSAPSIITLDTNYQLWLEWAIHFDAIINQKNPDMNKVKLYGDTAYRTTHFKGVISGI